MTAASQPACLLHSAVVSGPDGVEEREAMVQRDEDQEADAGKEAEGQEDHVKLAGHIVEEPLANCYTLYGDKQGQ